MKPTPDREAGERVLVLMPTARDAERTVGFLEEENIASEVCADLAELWRSLRAGAGALLLTDEALSSDTAGQLSEALREQPAWSVLPILVLAREGWSRVGEHLAPEQSSLVIVERPVRTRTLIGVVRSALRDRRHQYQARDALLLRQAQAELLIAQDEKLRFALTAGGLGSWDVCLDTLGMDCSDICKSIFGRSLLEPFTYQQFCDCIHPLDRERVMEAIDRCVHRGADYDIEYRVLWPNGELHWVLVRGRTTYDAGGRPRRMAGVSLDVTDRKRLHEALRQSESELARQADELLRAARRKDEFLATLAHELRNPLAPIRTGMDLLARSAHGDSARHTLGIMQRQIGHMVRLIDDLLDVSRITSGKLQLKRERVAISAIIEEAVEASRPLIERKSHTLRVLVQDGALALDADLTRIAQVIGNLLNNASNYTESGGLIELTVKRDADFALIEVRDNGIGIPADRIDDVFEMFSQVNRTLERSRGGLGIGLALVRSLVEMHGGSSSASSPGLGQGSTFTIRLPLARDSAASVPAPSLEQPSATDISKRILVVDDNEDAAEMLAMVLKQAGYRTQTAYDSRSALAAVAAWSPHVVILDIGLPDISGYDVARELRHDDRCAGLSLIALTGWGTRDDKQRAMDAGFDVHLTKPIDTHALHGALAQLAK
jgi:signal transduction histidine kinase/DNA-binding response OmpR family regulator